MNSQGSQIDAGVHWLIWDGSCDFCRRAVAWFQRLDREHAFRAVPYQDCPSPPMTSDLRESASSAMQVVTRDGRVLAGGRSVLFVLGTVGLYPRLMFLASKPPFVWLVELGYKVVARNRHLVSGLIFRDRADGPVC